MHKDLGKLDSQVVIVAKQTVINALETCDINHNEVCIKSALKSAPNGLLISVMDSPLEIRKSFKVAVIQLASSPRLLTTIAVAVARNAAVMPPITKFAVATVRKEIDESVKDLVFTSPSLPPFVLASSSAKSQKSRRNRALKKCISRRKSTLRSLEKDVWSLGGSLRETILSLTDSDLSRKRKDRALKLKALHATLSHVRSAFNYRKYRLLNNSQPNNGKTAIRTAKYSDRMETLMETYKFEEKDPSLRCVS